MDVSTAAHLPDETLLLLASGRPSARHHVEDCGVCQERLRSLRRQLSILDPTPVSPPPAVWHAIARSIRPSGRRIAAGLAASLLVAAGSVASMAIAPPASAQTLVGTARAASASAHIYAPLSGDLLFVASGLPQPGPDRVYELWSIRGRVHVPAAVFRPDGSGRVTLRLSAALAASAYGVTLEPAPGALRPGPDRILSELQNPVPGR